VSRRERALREAEYDARIMTHAGRFQVSTRGHAQVIDVSEAVQGVVAASGVRSGIACVLVVGSTAGLTTTEAEPGLLNHDLKAFFERVAPDDIEYAHRQTWNDDNGHAHVRASLLGPSVTIPVVDGRLTLGTWQQIVLIDFDTRPRTREVVVQVVGDR
jgi:secondary thiamine-phosphate synthase enzyme